MEKEKKIVSAKSVKISGLSNKLFLRFLRRRAEKAILSKLCEKFKDKVIKITSKSFFQVKQAKFGKS